MVTRDTPSSSFPGIIIGHFCVFSRDPIGKNRSVLSVEKPFLLYAGKTKTNKPLIYCPTQWFMVWDVYSVVQQTEKICFYQYIFLENIRKCRIRIPGKDVNVVLAIEL